jgi:fructokinase
LVGRLPSVTLRKPSVEDAARLGGAPSELPAAGPAAVVITRGGDGLTVCTRDGGEHSVPTEEADLVDTIDAGDTVNAATGWGPGTRCPRKRSPPSGQRAGTRLLRFAARTAAITSSRAGDEPPYAAELGGSSTL